MNETAIRPGPGWVVGPSIAMELGVALTAISGGFVSDALAEAIIGHTRSELADRRTQLLSLLGGVKSDSFSFLEHAANMADVLQSGDYDYVTLAIRELTVETALERVTLQAAKFDLTPNADLPAPERLMDLLLRLHTAMYNALGFKVPAQVGFARKLEQEIALAVRVLRDGDLHTRFWHWLDRFYLEFYRPWREAHLAVLEEVERRVITALGAREQHDLPPTTTWLPAQSPLLRYPELQVAVESGQLQVFFWVEPFGLSDSWSLQPGLVAVSFAEPGVIYEQFQAFTDDLAMRLKALADPTRLTILRLIRHFEAVNTEIADYLELARPTVSIHAKVLRDAGLIRSLQDGRVVRHEIVPSEIRRLFRDLERFLDLMDEE